MILRYVVLSLVFLIYSLNVCSSNATESEHSNGKPIIKVFTNFHTGFGTMNDRRGFEMERSYLGYEYVLGNGLKVKGVMDIGKSTDVGDYQRIAYIKNAMITWKYNRMTLNGGLISTTLFNLQEKFWENRFIMKSFQDYYGFGSSADLGLTLDYQFTDWLSADAMLVNGEGYKKVQVEDGLQYGLGITVRPLRGFVLRLYGSMNEASDKEEKDSYNIASFIGYKNATFSLACEYNRINNAKYIIDNNLEGISIYSNIKLSKSVKLFARYDHLFVEGRENKDKEEFKILGGVEFKIGKYIKIAPNFRYFKPKNIDVKDFYMAYINCSFGI